MKEIQFNPKSQQHGELVLESPCAITGRVRGDCAIGAFSYLEEQSQVTSTDIGRYCSIARNVTIGPTNHPTDWFSSHLFVFARGGAIASSQEYRKIRRPRQFAGQRLRTVIGNDVWIGVNAMIRRGVRIGDGAIVGAGAVVIRDVQPYEIVGGVPATHIRFRFTADIIARFQALAWWNYDLSSPALENVDYSDVPGTLATFEGLVARGTLVPLTPAVVRHSAALRAAEAEKVENARKVDKTGPPGTSAQAPQSTPPPAQRSWGRRLRQLLRGMVHAPG